MAFRVNKSAKVKNASTFIDTTCSYLIIMLDISNTYNDNACLIKEMSKSVSTLQKSWSNDFQKVNKRELKQTRVSPHWFFAVSFFMFGARLFRQDFVCHFKKRLPRSWSVVLELVTRESTSEATTEKRTNAAVKKKMPCSKLNRRTCKLGGFIENWRSLLIATFGFFHFSLCPFEMLLIGYRCCNQRQNYNSPLFDPSRVRG